MQVSQKTKNRASCNPEIFCFWYLPEENKTNNFKRFMYYDVYFCIIYNRQNTETT